VRRIWAVARTTLREAVRTRTAGVILVTVLAVVVVSPFALRGTGALPERVQLVLNYSLSAAGFLLSILTVFLATSSLAGDIREKRIETIATKPVRRWQIVVGKWVGVMLLNVALVVVAGVFTYVLVRRVVGRESAAKDKDEWKQLEEDVYVARHTVDPTPPDFEALISEEIRRRRLAGEMPEDLTEQELRKRRRVQLRTYYNSLAPGEGRGRKMEHVTPASRDEQLSVRYKVIATGPMEERPEENTVELDWIITPVQTPNHPDQFRWPTNGSMGDFHEFDVPASVVGPDGVVYIWCINRDQRLIHVGFPAEEGVQLLYRAGTFEWNFVRAMLLVLVRLGFLSALGLAAGAVLSFPVASLFVMSVFICALSVNHFVALSSPIAGTEEHPVFQSPAGYRPILKAVAGAVPNFGKYDGTAELATGRFVSWRLVVRGLIVVGAIYGGVVMALGCLYFAGRELAEAASGG